MKSGPEIVDFYGIITSSQIMKDIFEQVKRIARTDSSVLLRGETGTGKELFAKAIHSISPRQSHAFKALNCAALSKELMHSELFGHVKGAFTGASHDHRGVFHEAHKGSIFLDEIAELPLDLQSKLLRVLQEKTFNKVGSTKTEQVDVRFISATHTSLRQKVSEGLFREDLMYRIRVVPLFLPRLADRGEDIEVLTWKFIEEFNTIGHRQITRISKQARDAIFDYDWPGNIRELRNNIELAFAIGLGEELQLTDLSPELQGISPPQLTEFPKHEKKELMQALKKAKGNKGKAAEHCKMSRATFWRKCKYYGIY